MGGAFPPRFIENVRDAADIVRVVSEYVPLKPAGSRLKGLCPFHQEKTPSFHVDPDKKLFHCFGCQTGGDLFHFVQLYEKVNFPEAVELLARRFGVPMPVTSPAAARRENERERLLRLNDEAQKFFRASLAGSGGEECRAYLERRGLEAGTIEALALGYSPDAWEALRAHLQRQGFKPEELATAGLVLPRKSGSGFYDRFRGRLMFPIHDVQGRTLAFGGRTIRDDEPKYINSPETPAYIKGEHLYGLDRARDAIRREGFAVVVEGYLDLAALLQAGFDAVVASLGTAFTPQQARLLARYTQRVLVSYDGDAAGAKATERSLDLLLEQGFEIRVVELPAGQDPDDFLRSAGRTEYERLLREAPDYFEFLLRREVRTRNLDRIEEKIAAANAVLPHLARLSNSIERSDWAGRIADALRIEDGLVLQELRGALRTAQPRLRQRVEPAERQAIPWAEAQLVSLMLHSDEARRRAAESLDPGDLAGVRAATVVETILHMEQAGDRIDYPAVLAELDDEADREILTAIAFRDAPEEGPDVDDCVCALRRERLDRESRDAVRRLGRMQTRDEGPETEADGDSEDVDQWLLHVEQLAKQRDALQ